MSRIQKLLRFGARDPQLVVTAGVLLAAVGLGLRLVSFRALLDTLSRLERARGLSPSPDPSRVVRIVRAVRILRPCVPGASNCLTQALATLALLRWHGHPATLRIGVALDEGGQLVAHAWVESDGKVVIGRSQQQYYVAFPTLVPGALTD